MKHIYIACSLTHIPRDIFDDYHGFIRDIGDMIRRRHGFDVKYALKDSDPFLPKYPFSERPQRCYEWDTELVKGSLLVVAEVSFPATGIGMEIEMARQKRIPVMLLYRNYGSNLADEKEYRTADNQKHNVQIGNRIVSIMVQGNPAIVEEIQYADYSEGLDRLNRFMDRFKLHVSQERPG